MRTAPLRRFLASCIDFAGIERNVASGRLRAVALSAMSYRTGEITTFVHGGDELVMWKRHMRVAERADLSLEHLMASSAIPMMFPAVKIDDSYYGDGSVRQTAPLAPAIHLGARKVIAVAMRAQPAPFAGPERRAPAYPTAAEVAGMLLHSVFLDALDADAERLERINQLLELLPPETRERDDLRPIDLLMLRPSRDVGAMAEGLADHLPWRIRTVLRGVGGARVRSGGLLSYLLFEPEYTGLLMELGYDDTVRQLPRIERFLSS